MIGCVVRRIGHLISDYSGKSTQPWHGEPVGSWHVRGRSSGAKQLRSEQSNKMRVLKSISMALLLGGVSIAAPAISQAQIIGVSVAIAPPPLPIYAQPVIPG